MMSGSESYDFLYEYCPVREKPKYNFNLSLCLTTLFSDVAVAGLLKLPDFTEFSFQITVPNHVHFR